jgi:hypothetical protein
MEMPTYDNKNLLKERNICIIVRINYLLLKATVVYCLLIFCVVITVLFSNNMLCDIFLMFSFNWFEITLFV